MRQQYWVLLITAAAAVGLASTDSWALDLYVNDEYVEEDDEAVPPIPPEQDTLAGDCEGAPYETINEALEAASSGDTIILCNCDEVGGDPDLVRYFPGDGETATILMPVGLDSITIKSAFGPAKCIVSGTNALGGQYPVVRVDFTGSDDTTTLTLGDPDAPGMGLWFQDGAAPSEDLYPPYDPSGDSNASRGGGIRVMGKDATVEVYDCEISGNQSFEDGGGAYCHYGSSLSMNNCTITGNMANGKGGGIYCDPGGTVMLMDCSVDTNDVGLMGGGIFAPEGSFVGLEDTKVCSNTSGWHSKNIWGTFEDLGGMNCIAVDCGTVSECQSNADVIVTNGERIQDYINAAGPGDTIYVDTGTYNQEFLDMEGKAINLIALVPGTAIIDPGLTGGPQNDDFTPCIKFTSGETNLTVISGFMLRGGMGTPVFADALNPLGLPGTVGGGILCYRSMPTIDSCIIRANGYLNGPPFAYDGGGVYSGGQSEPILTGPTYLCSNYPNHLSGYVDVVGACESFECVPDNNFDNIPDSCQSAAPTTHNVNMASGSTAIADAIDQANSGDTISLAAGTYLETINPMGKAIQFVGAGTGQTILDGMGVNRLIICIVGETNNTTFSDLTVTGGYSMRGGGAWLNSSSPVFTNVEFTDNRSTDSGGGVYMSNGASPVFTDCTFDSNIADWMGGAIHALAGCRPVFTDTIFNNNQTGLTGGAVCLITAPSGTPPSYPPSGYPHGLVGNQPEFIRCTFNYNRAFRYGGGVFAGFASPALFEDCTFDNNAGEWGGGGIYVQSVYEYADLGDGEPPNDVLRDYYPTIAGTTVFNCCEPQAISGDAQAWYNPWWPENGWVNNSTNCLTCSPDVNNDLVVNHGDLFSVLGAWGNCEDLFPGDPDSPPAPVLCDEDVDGNYIVDIQDLILVLQYWRRTCPIQ